jgi:hypothetical protein
MSVLEDKAISVIDGMAVAAGHVAEQLGNLATQYGEDVVRMGLSVVQVNAVAQLMLGVLLALIGLVVYKKVFKPCFAAVMKFKMEVDHPGWHLGAAASFAVFVVLWVQAATKLLSVWIWVAVFKPELWIAYKILQGFLGKE